MVAKLDAMMATPGSTRLHIVASVTETVLVLGGFHLYWSRRKTEMHNIHIRSSDNSRPAKNLSRMSVAILALYFAVSRRMRR